MEPGIIIGVVLILIIAGIYLQSEGVKSARSAYQLALRNLRENPTSPTLRNEALRKGRIYANYTRNSKGVTVYDELAIKNDLDAATAAAAVVVGSRPITSSSDQVGTVQQRLATLESLRASGTISQDEYLSRRAKIIESI